ncbi:hypothetical protein HDU93_001366, partial [Gonapodya sp. JEL0774]
GMYGLCLARRALEDEACLRVDHADYLTVHTATFRSHLRNPHPPTLPTSPSSTYLVQPGYFDIFFPTDFELLRSMYLAVCRRPDDEEAKRAAQVFTHKEFLQKWGDGKSTRTKSGEDPMVDFYKNFKVFVS